MKGDFSRDTFSSRQHYSAVLMQQGRVQVDADWNEQRAIERHRIEMETRDLIGASGGQAHNAGFEIRVIENGQNLDIGAGDYYVDGILCQNEGAVSFNGQVDLPGSRVIDIMKGDSEVGLVYLDVWERHVTSLDDDHIREVALGGPDTSTRSRTVWQARVLRVEADTSQIAALQPLLEEHVETVSKLDDSPEDSNELRLTLAQTDNQILELLGVNCKSPFAEEMKAENPPSTGLLTARAFPPTSTESKCAVPPSAGYERLENQLYRVEIHQGGDRKAAKYKWSRDNGSVETAVVSVTPRAGATEIVVRDLGRDDPLGFANTQYVELVDDSREQSRQAGSLVQISDINPTTRTIIVNEILGVVGAEDARDFHYKLRRWDSAGALEMPSDDKGFVELEGGIEVRFTGDHFNTGDYWLIPARTATAEIEWPYKNVPENSHVIQQPLPQPPAGIEHHYSRLALVMAATVNEERQLLVLSDCRSLFPPLTQLAGLFYLGGDGQEAGSGQPLPRPLVVGVANGDRPVPSAQVSFEVQAEDLGSYDGKLEAEGNAGKSVTVTTNARGEAQCSWTLATNLPSQQVRASLLDGTHLPVYFNANLSAAGEAVAESIQITKLLLVNDQELRVDGNVPVDALAEGIQVVCDDDSIIDERSVAESPNCFVTLEMPFPQREDDQELWGEGIIGFRPLILAADLGVENNVILWRPADTTGAWLRDVLFQRFEGAERILARLTLKGNFIWDEKRPDAYLDGEVFGEKRGGADIALQFPSGDGRRGGDFEMWFWLVSQTLILDSLTLDRDRVTGGTQTMRGTVSILGTAPANGAPVKLVSSNPNVVSLPGGVSIDHGQSSASFDIRTVAVGADTPVTITAILETQQGTMRKSANLLVQPPVLSTVSVNPTTVTGKVSTVQGTVTLTGPSPAGGINVALSSADPNIVKIQQSSVTVPAGSNTSGFTVNTEPVSSPTPVTITASAQNVQKSTPLTVLPPVLTQLTLNPPGVLGGGASQGAVQLNGPAPSGFTVDLRSTNTAVATVQQSLPLLESSTGATFTVNSRPVASASQVSIVASRSDIERAATLSVQPPVISGFTFSPQTIAGDDASTGTITLNGPAPSGTSITLTGSNTITAIFPQSVAVEPGSTQVGFTATGRTFTGGNRTVTVTASYLGGSRSATLTVASSKSKEKDTKEKDKEEVDFASFEMLTAEGPRSTEGTAAADEEGTIDDTEEAPASGRPFIRREELPRLREPIGKTHEKP